ncbi:MAG: signal peptidase I [Firmicutes bacterium]|nr:signal peptidase I [Bacillota bacterium]
MLFLGHVRHIWSSAFLKDRLLAVSTVALMLFFSIFIALILSGKIGLLIVKSSSMRPYMAPGSLLIFKKATIAEIKPGEVVVFCEDRSSNLLVTHRVVDRVFSKGKIFLQTKGDANNRFDASLIGESQLVGKVVYVVPGMGWAVSIAKTPAGILFLNTALIALILLIIVDKIKAKERLAYQAGLGLMLPKDDISGKGGIVHSFTKNAGSNVN